MSVLCSVLRKRSLHATSSNTTRQSLGFSHLSSHPGCHSALAHCPAEPGPPQTAVSWPLCHFPKQSHTPYSPFHFQYLLILIRTIFQFKSCPWRHHLALSNSLWPHVPIFFLFSTFQPHHSSFCPLDPQMFSYLTILHLVFLSLVMITHISPILEDWDSYQWGFIDPH